MIDASLPLSVADRNGWVGDLYSVFGALGIAPTHEHICAVIAVAEQESALRVDPVIPGLGRIAWREIDERAARAGIPSAVVHEVLKLRSPNGMSYAERIDAARTEKQLSDIFEDFTGSIPLGRTLFASWNPIHTRGPMQVNVAFAHKFSAVRPYPYPLKGSLDDELFTRRGSLYLAQRICSGIRHLMIATSIASPITTPGSSRVATRPFKRRCRRPLAWRSSPMGRCSCPMRRSRSPATPSWRHADSQVG